MYKFGSNEPRSMNSFGVAGLLNEDAHVFYDSLFTTKHIGRVSDLLSARLQKAGADELRLRSLILLSLFEAYRMQSNPSEWMISTEKPLLEPMVIEVGIDEEKLAIGISFDIAEGSLLKPEGIAQRIQSGTYDSEFEKIIGSMIGHSDRLVIRFQPTTSRFEIVSLIGIPGKIDAEQISAEDQVEYIEFPGTAENTPKPQVYEELGDLDYPNLLKEDNSLSKHNASPSGSLLAEQASKNRAGLSKESIKGSEKDKDQDGSTKVGSGKTGDQSDDNQSNETKVGSKDSKDSDTGEVTFSGDDDKDKDGQNDKVTVSSGPNDGTNDLAGEKQVVKGGSSSDDGANEKQVVKDSGEFNDSDQSDIVKVKGWKEEENNEETRIKGSTDSIGDNEATKVKGHKDQEEITSEKEKEYQKKIAELNKRIKSLESELDNVRNSAGSGGKGKSKAGAVVEKETVSSDGVDQTKIVVKSIQTEDDDEDEDEDDENEDEKIKKKKKSSKVQKVEDEDDEEDDDDDEEEEYENEDDEDEEDDDDEDEDEDEDDEDDEEDEEESGKKKGFGGFGKFLKKKGLKKMFSFKKKKGDEEEDDDEEDEEDDELDDIDLDLDGPIEDDSSDKYAKDDEEGINLEQKKIVDPTEVAKDLENFGKGGSFDKTLKRAEKNYDKLKPAIKSPKVKKFVGGLLEDLTKEKAKFNEMIKELNRSMRQKELQFQNGEKALEEELKRRDGQIKVKDREIQRVKDQMSQLTMNLERVRTQAANAAADAQYKKKFNYTKNMLSTAQEDGKKLKKEISELKTKLNQAKKAGADGPSEVEFENQKKSFERVQKGYEQLKRENNATKNQLREAEQKTKSANMKMAELKKRMDSVMKVVGEKKEEVANSKTEVEKIEAENAKLKRNIASLQKEILRMKNPDSQGEEVFEDETTDIIDMGSTDDDSDKGSAA